MNLMWSGAINIFFCKCYGLVECCTQWAGRSLAVLLLFRGLFLVGVQAAQDAVLHARPDRVSVRVSEEKPQYVLRLPLPPSAVITRTESGKNVWRQLGHMPAHFTAVGQSFQARLYRGGWSAVMHVPVRDTSPRTEISIWQRDNVRIMLMLWEEDVNRTGFSWGLESGDPGGIFSR